MFYLKLTLAGHIRQSRFESGKDLSSSFIGGFSSRYRHDCFVRMLTPVEARNWQKHSLAHVQQSGIQKDGVKITPAGEGVNTDGHHSNTFTIKF